MGRIAVVAVVAASPTFSSSRPVETAAHAQVVGSDPADGAQLDQPPETVTIHLDNKPATLEGDPLRIYGPDGRRLDTGAVHVAADGRELSIDLGSDHGRWVSGSYTVVYRVVSADSHLVAGRLGFDVAGPAEMPTGRAALANAPTDDPAGLVGFRYGRPPNPWARAVGVGAAAGLTWWALRRRRSHGSV